MARYRSKDETDMRWNRIRRRITRELDTQIMDRREEALDKLLTQAWIEYTNQIATGEVRELTPTYTQLVGEVLGDVLDAEIPKSDAAA